MGWPLLGAEVAVVDSLPAHRMGWLVVVVTCAAVAAVAVASAARARPRPPRELLALYAFVVPFGSGVEFPLPRGFDNLSSLVGAAVIFGLALYLVGGRGRASGLPVVALPWFLLLVWAAMSVLWSVDVGRSVPLVIALLAVGLLYVTAVHVTADTRFLLWLAAAAAAGGLLLAANALRLAATGQIEQVSGQSSRFASEGGDPNHTAAALLLPLALTLWWSVDADSTSRRMAGRLGALLLLSAIVLTGSRGGLVAAIVALAVIGVTCGRSLARRFGVTLLWVILAAAVSVLIAPPDVQNRLSRPDSTGRSDIWHVGVASCYDSCWLGSGWGAYGSAYRQEWLSDLALTGNGNKFWAAHNIALGALVETGVVGLLLLLAGSFLLIRALLRLPRRVRGAPLAALISLLVSAMFVSSLSYKYFWLTLLFATLVVKVHAAGSRRPEPEAWVEDTPTPSPALSRLGQ